MSNSHFYFKFMTNQQLNSIESFLIITKPIVYPIHNYKL